MLVRELEDKDAEDQRDDQLPDELGRLIQPQVPGLKQLDEVIGETERARAQCQKQHEQTRRGKTVVAGGDAVNPRRQVGHHDADDDGDTTHRRSTALPQVRLGAFLTDFLPLARIGEITDDGGGGENRNEEAHDSRDDDLGQLTRFLLTAKCVTHIPGWWGRPDAYGVSLSGYC